MEREKIGAFPAKRFFVDMLTRDIELQDAILDLLVSSALPLPIELNP